jgi:O-antigen ligase
MTATAFTGSALVRRAPTIWLRDHHQAWIGTAMVATLIVLMIVPEGFDYEGLNTLGGISAGGSIGRVLWLSLLFAGLSLIAWRAKLAWLLVRQLNPWLLLFAVLAVLSVIWSIDSQLSLRRLLRMGTMIVVCVAFVLVGWHSLRYQNVVRPVLTAMLIGSLAFGFLFPALAIHHESAPELAGAWRGLANHKNGLGALASFALILWFHSALTGEVKALWATLGCGVAASCLWLSRSSTAMIATVFVMAFLLIALRSPRALRRYLPQLVAVMVATLLLYALAILDLVPGLGALLAPISALSDKSTSLTGRTEIWKILTEHIALRPLLGSGYGAYWASGAFAGTESFAFIRQMNGFYPGSAHNGYLEVVNDLGWAGLTCLIAYMVCHLRQSLQLLTISPNQGLLYLAIFFQQLITNISESHWFSVLSIDFVFMTLASTALARGLLEIRLQAVFGAPARAVAPPTRSQAQPGLMLNRVAKHV